MNEPNLRFAEHYVQKYIYTAIIFLSAALLTSCDNTKYLSKGQYYYRDTHVELADSTPLPPNLENLEDDLEDLSAMSANSKLLGIYPLKLWLYNVGDTGIDIYVRNRSELERKFLFFNFEKVVDNLNLLEPHSKFRNWLMYKAGEPPAIIDTALIEQTETRIENYLYNRGFFYPSVNYTVDYQDKKRRADVTYITHENILYRMHNIVYEIDDPELKRIVLSIPEKSNLEKGNTFDVEYIKSERSRITNHLLNNGYMKFEKDYVYFEADTSTGSDSLDIYVKISNPKDDSLHRRFRINKIFVYPNAEKDYSNSSVSLDTIHYRDDKSDYYIVSSDLKYKPRSLGDNIFINDSSIVRTDSTVKLQPRYYSLNDFRQTVSAFSNTSIFKYITIDEVLADTGVYFRYIDVIIKLEPLKTKQLGAEFNTSITSDYLLGNSLNFTFTQKNLLHRLDQIRFSIYGGIETQITGNTIFINTSEFSSSIDLVMPRFFWPLNIRIPKRDYPKTITGLKVNYINRISLYELFNTSYKYGGQWYENGKEKQWNFNLFDITLVNVLDTSAAFNELLQDNLLLLQSFQEQLIFGPDLTFTYNSQLKRNKRNDIYFKGTIEGDGHAVYLFQWLADRNGPVPYTIGNLPYSTMTKLDLDLRDYYDFNSSNALASRFLIGIAVPYLNSKVVPYVKQYFAGGTTDIRAFALRELGPGSYFPYIYNADLIEGNADDSIYSKILGDQTGNLKLEMNVEYRFDILWKLKGAFFCDLGNIWTLKEDPFRPGSGFSLNDFLGETAIGPGAGIRLDVSSYFVIRLDAAWPLRDPSMDTKENRAILDNYAAQGFVIPEKTITWNIAINYPF